MMSDRERWIVYPLLFFAILLAARARFPQPADVECRTVRCNELIVQAMDGAPRIRIASSRSQSGQLQLFGAEGQLALHLHTDPSGRRGTLETLDDGARTRTELGANSGGGYVKLYGKDGLPSLFYGHDGRREVSGLLAYQEQKKPQRARLLLWGLPLPWVQDNGLNGDEEPHDAQASDRDRDPATDPPAEAGRAEKAPASQATPRVAPQKNDREIDPSQPEIAPPEENQNL